MTGERGFAMRRRSFLALPFAIAAGAARAEVEYGRVEAARTLKIDAIHFQGAESLKAELTKRNVTF